MKADEGQRAAYLLNAISRDGLEIYDGLPAPKVEYLDILERFDEYFGGGTSKLLQRKVFFAARQASDESVTQFACRIRRLIKDCGFADEMATTLLRDIFVCGVSATVLGERLMAEDPDKLTFERAIQMAESFERARADWKSVGAGRQDGGVAQAQLAAVTSNKSTHVRQSSWTPHGKGPRDQDQQWQGRVTGKKPCFRCARVGHLANDPKCPARNQMCRTCGKSGHFAIACKVKVVSAISGKDGENCSSGAEYNLFAMRKDGPLSREVSINGVGIDCIIDTGADVNVISKSADTMSVISTLDIRPSKVVIKAWGNFPLVVLGSADCSVEYQGKVVSDTFFVVDVPGSKPLLTFSLCHKLGLMAELASVSRDGQDKGRLSGILEKHSAIFTQGGKLTDVSYKIHVRQDAVPYAPAARRVPPALLESVKIELYKMVEKGIIEEVTGPSEWCAPTVIVFKHD